MLLNLLEKVCKEHIHNLEEPLANDLIELASTELTKDPVSCLMMWVLTPLHQLYGCVWCLPLYIHMYMHNVDVCTHVRMFKLWRPAKFHHYIKAHKCVYTCSAPLPIHSVCTYVYTV